MVQQTWNNGDPLLAVRQKIDANFAELYATGGAPGTSANVLQFIPGAEHAAILAGTSTYDCTSDLNDALQYASDNDIRLYIPAGKYKITDTLWLTPAGSSGRTVNIEGDGSGNVAGSRYCTLIDASGFTDRPSANIQFARNVVIRGLRILGGGKDIASAVSEPGELVYGYDYVGSSRDDRYSPYCGIAIDAGLGATPPGGGYPSITYRGLVSGSQNLVFENVAIENFVVGFMISPDGATQQCDVIRLDNVQIRNTKVAIASGQDQANAVVITGGDISYCRTAFDGLEYGEQTGKDFLFVGTHFLKMFEMVSHSSGYGGGTFIGGYAESVHRIGQVGLGATVIAVPLQLVNFSISMLTVSEGKVCPILLETSGPATFSGGYIRRADDTMYVCNIIGNAVALRETQLRLVNRHRPFVGSSINSPTVMRNCRVVDSSAAVTYGQEARRSALSGRFSASTHEPVQHAGSGAYAFLPGFTDTYQTSGGALSNVVFSSTQLVFDDTDAAGSYVVGDLLYWLMNEIGKSLVQHRVLAARVTAIAAPTVTCDLLFDRAYYDETDTAGPVRIGVHEWAPEVSLTGDLSSGSTSIMNVSPTTILQVGDWLSASSGLATRTRVTAIAGSTVTISRNATANVTGASLYCGRLVSIT